MERRKSPRLKKSAPVPRSRVTCRHATPYRGSSGRVRSFLRAFGRLCPIMRPPTVKVSDAGETAASLPALLFQVRLPPKFRDIANTKVRNQGQRRRDAQGSLQLFEIKNADPSD